MKQINNPVGDPIVGGQVAARPETISRLVRLKSWWKRHKAGANAPLTDEERLELQSW